MEFSLQSLAENYFLWFILVLGVLYYCVTYNHGYWASKGVPFIAPVPLFGNAFRTTLCTAPRVEVQQENYEYFSGLPYGGIYEFFTPKLMLRDPELIEQILVKDFSVFMNRGQPRDPKLDPLSNHLVNLTGGKWRSLRTKLTPTFSSGKLKTMLSQVEKCSDMLVDVLEKKSKSTPIEVKSQMAEFTIDVIGCCAFGLDFNVLHNPDSPFMKIGMKAFAPSKLGMIRLMLRGNFPGVLRFFKWKALPNKMEDFFINTVRNTIKEREEKNIHRNDFVQLMMEIRKQEEKQTKKSEDEIVLDDLTFAANAFVFLLAGFETTATTLSYLLYELAKNQDIQQKLYNEVTEVMKKHKNEITWESIKDMTYLEQALCETLRKHPPVAGIQRQSLRAYRLPNSSLELPEGSIVSIPIHSLHHDPKYYPDPEKFDPDRFSEENKEKIVKGTYLPFGDGPRICIGLRFAKVEVKVAVTKLISKFQFKLNPKTKDPLKFSAETLFITPIGGLWIDFIPRK